jgi:hypothetical protein
MKRIIPFFILSLASLLTACNKDDINNTEDRVGISRVTRFPVFTMNGDRYMSIVQGGTYTEPGVTAKEGTADLQITTTGSVDANTVGVYDITYTATNKDGFPGTVTRTIAVLPAPEQAGVDISGDYKYATSSVISHIEKLAPGFYKTDNVWGSSTIPSYIITVDGVNWILPEASLSGFGPVYGDGTLSGTALQYHVNLPNYGFVNIVRNWVKL